MAFASKAYEALKRILGSSSTPPASRKPALPKFPTKAELTAWLATKPNPMLYSDGTPVGPNYARITVKSTPDK
jgi:hypothetical protein